MKFPEWSRLAPGLISCPREMGPGKQFPAPRMPWYVWVVCGDIPLNLVQPKNKYQKPCPRAWEAGRFKLV